ncbi:1-deoxy-D-xylulose-5-phosphate reductoisomerase [bacterium]|nr:1-deoxy-D-xylulose-5-phosphate reductoisomerase [bacterium]MBU1882180.1 1-deoxy-D-xylulose-5-phosphate reductoisomerase [bacterium]
MKNVVVLGSTGSIGCSTLDVISSLENNFNVYALAARSQIDLITEQALKFKPKRIGLADESSAAGLVAKLGQNSLELVTGETALVDLAQDSEADIVVNALVGAVGLKATLAALKAGKVVALANKESIVMAGTLVMEAVAESDGWLVPIDSEHSAILQCLRGEAPKQVSKLLLTASGGPFLRRPKERFAAITPEEALKHPNWKMGPKISIDSATMMNKGLEVIEAHYLFNLPPEKIEVIVHPQSIIHSMVEYVDGSIKAQLSQPDMRVPIQYALTYPDRYEANFVATDMTKVGSLSFEAADLERFPCLRLSYEALQSGNGYPTVLNAANEIAVEAFLHKEITFNDIPALVEKTLDEFKPPVVFDLESILEIDDWARRECSKAIKNLKKVLS